MENKNKEKKVPKNTNKQEVLKEKSEVKQGESTDIFNDNDVYIKEDEIDTDNKEVETPFSDCNDDLKDNNDAKEENNQTEEILLEQDLKVKQQQTTEAQIDKDVASDCVESAQLGDEVQEEKKPSLILTIKTKTLALLVTIKAFFVNLFKNTLAFIKQNKKLSINKKTSITKVKTARQISNERRRGYVPPKDFAPKQARSDIPSIQKSGVFGILNRVLSTILVIFLLIGTVITGAGFVYINSLLAEAPIIAIKDLEPPPSTLVLDDKKEIIAELGLELRRNVTYDELPQCIIDAFVSIEDSRFFIHNGFDLPRFVKAAMVNLKNGDFSQGGSTFTMQMIKNAYFVEEGSGGAMKSIERKIQEIYLSLVADDIVDKKVIFQNYVNKNNYGGPYRGIQKASEYYFNKNVQDVSLAEAALLAGVINLPNYYNPYLNLQAATERRDEVLDMMVTHGYITEFECEMTKAIRIEDTLTGNEIKKENLPYQGYVDTVIDEVIRLTGEDPYITPMIIHTSMDTYSQQIMEDIQANKYKEINVARQKGIDTATVVIRNKTGEITVIGPGRFYNQVQRGFNFATSMKKQPGSSIKPVLDYALAFEHLGYNTGMLVYDYPIYFPDSRIKVNNFTGSYSGAITIQNAISWSQNVPAVIALRQVEKTIGSDKIIEYMHNIGMTWVNKDNYSPQLAIGGASFQTSPLEMASAYQMLFNYGLWIEPHTIQKIEYYDTTREDYIANPKQVQALSQQAAWLSASMMKAHVDRYMTSTAVAMRKNYPVYGKTGTSDWGSDGRKFGLRGNKDKWLIGCTVDYSMATWVGFDVAAKGHSISQRTASYNVPGKINRKMLDAINHDEPKPGLYKRPPGIESVTVAKGYFPFVRPFAGSGSTTGLAKKGATRFVERPVPPEMPQVEAFTIKSVGYDTYRITFNKPKEISYLGSNPDQFGIYYLKQKPNNPASLWGKYTYNGIITYNGGTYPFSSSTNVFDVSLPDHSYGVGGNIHACGFFGFTKIDLVSDTVCSSTAENPRPIVPTCSLGFHYDSLTGSCVPD